MPGRPDNVRCSGWTGSGWQRCAASARSGFRNKPAGAAFHCMKRGDGSAAGPRNRFSEKPRRRTRKRFRYGSRCGVLLDYLGVDVYCVPIVRYACCLKPAAHASATARRTEHSYGRSHLVLKASCLFLATGTGSSRACVEHVASQIRLMLLFDGVVPR